jgi:hypothetical protein
VEEDKLNNTGITVQAKAVNVIHHQKGFRPARVSGIPDCGMSAYSATKETGARKAKGHDVFRKMNNLIIGNQIASCWKVCSS